MLDAKAERRVGIAEVRLDALPGIEQRARLLRDELGIDLGCANRSIGTNHPEDVGPSLGRRMALDVPLVVVGDDAGEQIEIGTVVR